MLGGYAHEGEFGDGRGDVGEFGEGVGRGLLPVVVAYVGLVHQVVPFAGEEGGVVLEHEMIDGSHSRNIPMP